MNTRMKKMIFALMLLLMAVGIISCRPDSPDPNGSITGVTEDVFFEAMGEVQAVGYKEHFEEMIKQASESNDETSSILIDFAKAQMDSVDIYQEECIKQAGANFDIGADGEGAANRLLGYEYVTIRYRSIDHKGKPVMLSTLVAWPFNNIIPDADANNIVIGCHVTIGSNAERPTNYKKGSILSDVGMMVCCSRVAYGSGSSYYENLVIIPDYQGYGATHGEVHPYLQQELTARQVVDGVIAGKEYYEKVIKHKLEKDWRSMAVGYSQGGSVAMAVHRYIEQNNLHNRLRYQGTVCGDGPYDPIATLKQYISENKIYMPVAAGMIIHSMCNTNARVMGKYKTADYVTPKCINSGMFDLIKEKKLNTDEMNAKLLEHSVGNSMADTATALCMYRKADDEFYLYCSENKDKYDWETSLIKTSYAKTSDMFLPEVINWFNGKKDPAHKAKMEALEAALLDNVLHHGWMPLSYIYLYHTVTDEVVPLCNYENCLKSWKGTLAEKYVKGIRYTGVTQSHVNYGTMFFLYHLGDGMRQLIDDDCDEDEFDDTKTGL